MTPLFLLAIGGLRASVTLNMPAMPVSRALLELSRQSGITLGASGDTQDEMICMRLDHASPSQTMEKLAFCLHATWEKSGQGFRLVRTALQKKEEEDEEFRRRLANIKSALAAQIERFAKMPAWNADVADRLARQLADLDKHDPTSTDYQHPQELMKRLQQRQELVKQCPAARVFGQILPLLDPDELAHLDTDVETVWSSDPNAMERPLDPRIAAALTEAAAEDQQWQSARERIEGSDNGTQRGQMYAEGIPIKNPEDTFQVTNRVLLVASPSEEYFPTLTLLCVDPNGRIVSGFNFNDQEQFGQNQPAAPKTPGVALTASPEILELAATQGWQKTKLPAEPLKSKLLNPERAEFLGLALSPFLIQLAQAKGVQMVASLDDEAWNVLIQGEVVKCERDLVERLSELAAPSSDDGWLIFRPPAPRRVRENRSDRFVLGSYLRAALETGHPTLEARAQADAALPNASLPEELLSAIRGRSNMWQSGDAADPETMRFYGSLSEVQRMALPRGLPISTLTAGQLARLRRWVFGTRPGLQPVPKDSSAGAPGIGIQPSGLVQFAIGAECFPNGLPTDGYIRLSETDSDEAIAPPPQMAITGVEFEMPPQYMSPQAIASTRTRTGGFMPSSLGMGLSPDLSKLQLGFSRELNFTFRLTPSVQFTKQLSEHVMTNDNPVPYDQLPATFRAEVDKEAARMRDPIQNNVPPPGSGG